MGMFRVLSGVLKASSAGLALAERIRVSAGHAEVQGAVLELTENEIWNVTYSSQAESAALLAKRWGGTREWDLRRLNESRATVDAEIQANRCSAFRSRRPDLQPR